MIKKRRNVCKGILSLVGVASIACVVGSTTSFADDEEFTDSAKSEVDILIKEDPNVGNTKIFKFDSVPTGFRFTGEASSNKITMTGNVEGEQNNIVLKTDIDPEDMGTYSVTGKMETVTKGKTTTTVPVDTFTLKVGDRNVSVKSGDGNILTEKLGSTVDTSNPFYNYVKGDAITSPILALPAGANVAAGDLLQGELVYTLSGTIDFS